MFSRRTDLPLERDQISQFLPWLVAFLVYLGVLSLTAMLALDGVAERWKAGASETLTVEVPASGGKRIDAKRMKRLIDVIKETSGVINVEAMPEGRILALIEPWFGSGLALEEAAKDLPLPDLIDVSVDADNRPNADALQSRLQGIVAGVVVDDHGIWLGGLINLVRMAEVLASAFVIVIGVVTVGTVIFTTRTGLSIHRDVIEVLHLTGARDLYVARQFAGRALGLALKGGVVGFALAAGTIYAVNRLAGDVGAGIMPGLSVTLEDWALLAAIPLSVAFLAMLTARITVTRTLRRML